MRQDPSCNLVSNTKICIFLREADCFGILKRRKTKSPLNVFLSMCNLFFTHLLPCIYYLPMIFWIFSPVFLNSQDLNAWKM